MQDKWKQTSGDETQQTKAVISSMKGKTKHQLSLEQLMHEWVRENKKEIRSNKLRNAIFLFLAVAATAVLLAMLIIPVLRINGTSMTNTLSDRDVVVALNGSKYKAGDVIAFYYNNTILVKRVIAGEGDWVEIDNKGNVYINGKYLDEPYVSERALGNCNIEFPYQVPQNRLFILGDHRKTSLDSRNTAIGCIDKSLVIGRIILRVWPITAMKIIK